MNEEYLLYQWESSVTQDRWKQRQARIDEFHKIIRGDWRDLYKDGTPMPGTPRIENLVRNGVRDISNLAAQIQPRVLFIREGEKDDADVDAEVRESIAETHWKANRGRRSERTLYRDAIGTGMIVVAVAFSDQSLYPTFTRLRPDRCFPDVRNGTLEDLVYVERVTWRDAARKYPSLPKPPAWSSETVDVVEYYDDYEVVSGVVFHKEGRIPDAQRGQAVTIVDRWEHGLGCVPVGYAQLDEADDAIRGLYDQAGAALVARNRIVQFLIDYLEEMVHAPYEEKGIENWKDAPGKGRVYHHREDVDETFIRRIPPAAPAGAVFGLGQMLEDASLGETHQPPSRVGQVSQSIASASFVEATQGRLTSIVQELQDMMADVRQQLVYIGFKVDKAWLDTKKPLYRPVLGQKTYTPHVAIGDWLECEVEFGAGSGYDRATGDVRVLQHLGARLVSREDARMQVDYLRDASATQAQIDREDTIDAMKQRFLTDPRMPLGSLGKLATALADGTSFIEAIKQVLPELEAADQAAQAQPAAAPEGMMGEEGAPLEGMTPEEQEAAMEAGAGAEELGQPVNLPMPPLQQQFVRSVP